MEKMIVVAIMGIVAAFTAPNVQTMLNRMKLKQAVTDVRGALEETQRVAVRENKLCSITLNLIKGEVTGDCLITGRRTLDAELAIATNLLDASSGGVARAPSGPVFTDVTTGIVTPSGNPPKVAMTPQASDDPDAPKAAVQIQIISAAGGNCGSQGEGIKHCEQTIVPIQFGALGNAEFEVATNQSDSPHDPTGKIVLYLPEHDGIEKQCVAISNTLGLTRLGKYTGTLAPAEITDSGTCTAIDWEEQ